MSSIGAEKTYAGHSTKNEIVCVPHNSNKPPQTHQQLRAKKIFSRALPVANNCTTYENVVVTVAELTKYTFACSQDDAIHREQIKIKRPVLLAESSETVDGDGLGSRIWIDTFRRLFLAKG